MARPNKFKNIQYGENQLIDFQQKYYKITVNYMYVKKDSSKMSFKTIYTCD